MAQPEPGAAHPLTILPLAFCLVAALCDPTRGPEQTPVRVQSGKDGRLLVVQTNHHAKKPTEKGSVCGGPGRVPLAGGSDLPPAELAGPAALRPPIVLWSSAAPVLGTDHSTLASGGFTRALPTWIEVPCPSHLAHPGPCPRPSPFPTSSPGGSHFHCNVEPQQYSSSPGIPPSRP